MPQDEKIIKKFVVLDFFEVVLQIVDAVNGSIGQDCMLSHQI